MFWALGQLLRCKEGETPALREWTVYCGRQGECGRGQDSYSGEEKPGVLWEPHKTLEGNIGWGWKYTW